jgi:hypothetical protein
LPGQRAIYGSFSVAELDPNRNSDSVAAGPLRTAWYDCPADHGWYRELGAVEDPPATRMAPLEAGQAFPVGTEWLVVDRSCRDQLHATLGEPLLSRGNYDVFALPR